MMWPQNVQANTHSFCILNRKKMSVNYLIHRLGDFLAFLHISKTSKIDKKIICFLKTKVKLLDVKIHHDLWKLCIVHTFKTTLIDQIHDTLHKKEFLSMHLTITCFEFKRRHWWKGTFLWRLAFCKGSLVAWWLCCLNENESGKLAVQ